MKPKSKPKEPERILVYGDNERDDDWLKYLDGGSYQRDDLAAHEEAARLHKERERKKQDRSCLTGE